MYVYLVLYSLSFIKISSHFVLKLLPPKFMLKIKQFIYGINRNILLPFLKKGDSDCDLFPGSPSSSTTTTPITVTTSATNGTSQYVTSPTKNKRESGTKGKIHKNLSLMVLNQYVNTPDLRVRCWCLLI